MALPRVLVSAAAASAIVSWGVMFFGFVLAHGRLPIGAGEVINWFMGL